MGKNIPYFAILIVLLYALYNANVKEDLPARTTPSFHTAKEKSIQKTEQIKDELADIHSIPYKKQYIIDVINHGSHQFGLSGGEMEGGFASPADAEKIACYVLELSHTKCNTAYEQNAAMFYSSNCAGCHGDNGKGMKGIYPDLTKEKLLGIEKREDFLKNLLKREK